MYAWKKDLVRLCIGAGPLQPLLLAHAIVPKSHMMCLRCFVKAFLLAGSDDNHSKRVDYNLRSANNFQAKNKTYLQ